MCGGVIIIIAGAVQSDGMGLLVVAGTNDAMPQTKEHLLLAIQVPGRDELVEGNGNEMR